MGLTFRAVQNTPEDIDHLATMAAEIWNEYWPDIIGQDQTTYMVEQFQSAPAITRDMNEHNYRYWILVDDDGNDVGFTGGATEQMDKDAEHNRSISHSPIVDEKWPLRFFISKIYLYANQRGKHYASKVITFYGQLCKDEGIPAMYLTVNKYNELGIRAYEGKGFTTVDTAETDIGHGYIMDDFIMLKPVE